MKTDLNDPTAAFHQVVCIILDGVGVGEAPDAAVFGDAGSNSLGEHGDHVGSLRLPSLGRLGLGNITPDRGRAARRVSRGVLREDGAGVRGKGQHERALGTHGVRRRPSAFPVYPSGFPRDLVDEFERRIGRKVIGNKAASGTEIIEELGRCTTSARAGRFSTRRRTACFSSPRTSR